MSVHARELSGKEAHEYVSYCLRQGNSLARFLLEQLDLASGRVLAFLPSEVSDEAAKDFNSGGILPISWTEYVTEADGLGTGMVPKPTLYEPLLGYVQDFLSHGDFRACVLENATAEPHFPGITSYRSRLLIHKNEIYHVLLDNDFDGDNILRAVKEAESWMLVGVLTRLLTEELGCLETGKFSGEVLRSLASRTEHIIVGAYDGESYLIWSRSAPP